MRLMYPDYDQEISNKVLPLIQKDPILAETLRNSPNPAMAAYILAKHLPGTPQTQTNPAANPAKKITENLQKPGSPGQVSGGGAVSKADIFAQMSDEELEKEIARVKRGE